MSAKERLFWLAFHITLMGFLHGPPFTGLYGFVLSLVNGWIIGAHIGLGWHDWEERQRAWED